MAQRLGDLPLRRLVLLEELGVVEHLGRHLDRIRLGTRLGDPDQHLLLLGGVALDHLDEVRDQVGPPLILIHDLAPRGLDGFVLLLQ